MEKCYSINYDKERNSSCLEIIKKHIDNINRICLQKTKTIKKIEVLLNSLNIGGSKIIVKVNNESPFEEINFTIGGSNYLILINEEYEKNIATSIRKYFLSCWIYKKEEWVKLTPNHIEKKNDKYTNEYLFCYIAGDDNTYESLISEPDMFPLFDDGNKFYERLWDYLNK